MDSERIEIRPHTQNTWIAWLHQPGKPDFPMQEGTLSEMREYARLLTSGTAWENVPAFYVNEGIMMQA